MLPFAEMQKELLRGNKLIALLIKVVIDTHDYTNLTEHKEELAKLTEGLPQ